MAANRKEVDELDPSTAQGKLGRLLETETELDKLLQETKRRAAEIVDLSRAEAEDRIRRFEMELDAANLALRDRLVREQEEAIAAIRAEAENTVKKLEALDDQRVDELARYVLERVAGPASEDRS
jgi:DNA anti-recombination protein RmuC